MKVYNIIRELKLADAFYIDLHPLWQVVEVSQQGQVELDEETAFRMYMSLTDF